MSKKFGGTEKDTELKEDVNLIKSLIYEHPVRSILCVPVVINIIFLIYAVITYNFHNVIHATSLSGVFIVSMIFSR